jgi:hypothetical protein
MPRPVYPLTAPSGTPRPVSADMHHGLHSSGVGTLCMRPTIPVIPSAYARVARSFGWPGTHWSGTVGMANFRRTGALYRLCTCRVTQFFAS